MTEASKNKDSTAEGSAEAILNGQGSQQGSMTKGFTILGLEPTPEVLAIFLVYFVQGILGLSRLAVSYYFKDELHLNPAELAVFTGLGAVPWLIKPIYGFVSDTFPLFGYRRRSYLMLCGILGALSWATLCVLKPGALMASGLLLLGSVGTACSDVVVDSIVVERARGKPTSVAAIGGVISSYFSGSLIDEYGVGFVFGVTALFPMLVSGSALLIHEKPASHPGLESSHSPSTAVDVVKEDFIMQGQKLWKAIRQPNIFYPAIFVFLWQATPAADSALFYFYTNELHFGPEFMGRIRLVGSLSSLAGVWLYNSYLKKVPLRSMFKWSAIIGTVLGLTQVLLVTGVNRQLGLSDELFTVSDEIIVTVLGRISFMPVLVLASTLCPEGVEATLFATLMSILNGGGVTGSFIGSAITQGLGVTADKFDNLALLVTICSLSTLLPLPFLTLVPKDINGKEDDDEDKKDNEKQV